VPEFCAAFERRRNLVVSGVSAIDGLHLHPPGGAFYALIDASALIGKTSADANTFDTDAAVAGYLLSEARVAGVPGSVYGTPGYFRISTACSDGELSTALERISEAVSKLTRT